MGIFKGKNAVVTGAAGVIGRAVVSRLIEGGARVALVDHDQDAVQSMVAMLGSEVAIAISVDVAKASHSEYYAHRTYRKLGPIDIFFNNAAIEGPTSVLGEYADEDFEKVTAVNVTGVFNGLKHVIPRMRDGGAIVISSSTAGLRGTYGSVGYTMSKHAVVGLMRTAAIETAARRIRVNTVHPAMVNSKMMMRIEQSTGRPEEVHEEHIRRIPFGRYVEPDEVAALVSFLVSDDARMITGGQYTIDGGFLL